MNEDKLAALKKAIDELVEAEKRHEAAEKAYDAAVKAFNDFAAEMAVATDSELE